MKNNNECRIATVIGCNRKQRYVLLKYKDNGQEFRIGKSNFWLSDFDKWIRLVQVGYELSVERILLSDGKIYYEVGIQMDDVREPLFERVSSSEYRCTATHNKCDMVTNYFVSFAKYVKWLAETNSPRVFRTSEKHNLCEVCPVYQALIKNRQR